MDEISLELFNPAYLNKLLSFDSMPKDEQKEFTMTFLEEVEMRVNKLKSLVKNDGKDKIDYEAVHQETHGIIGSAKTFGAVRLAHEAEKLEKMSKTDMDENFFSQAEILFQIFEDTSYLLSQKF